MAEMWLQQLRFQPRDGWPVQASERPIEPQLVLVFGGRFQLANGDWLPALATRFPGADIVGCSTAGEIAGVSILDDAIIATAIEFEHTRVKRALATVPAAGCSADVGRQLAAALPTDGLVHVFVLSDGLAVNGSELVDGLTQALPPDVTVTGGLSGDGGRFEETLVVAGEVRHTAVVALGFYGERLRVGYGSLGGWDPFGPYRRVTRAKGNVLYELDGRSVLALYTRYLGDHARELPASGLLYPLSIRRHADDEPVVRTILAVDEASGSMTFAGDVPVGAEARFMKANFNRLLDGAAGAAKITRAALGHSPELAILISCVGRKMVLGQRVEEEVEAVREVLGPEVMLAGFYSYGEISPFTPGAKCNLHNQTMTITTFREE